MSKSNPFEELSGEDAILNFIFDKNRSFIGASMPGKVEGKFAARAVANIESIHETPSLELLGVWCLVFGVWCLVFGVWCLVFGGFPSPCHLAPVATTSVCCCINCGVAGVEKIPEDSPQMAKVKGSSKA